MMLVSVYLFLVSTFLYTSTSLPLNSAIDGVTLASLEAVPSSLHFNASTSTTQAKKTLGETVGLSLSSTTMTPLKSEDNQAQEMPKKEANPSSSLLLAASSPLPSSVPEVQEPASSSSVTTSSPASKSSVSSSPTQKYIFSTSPITTTSTTTSTPPSSSISTSPFVLFPEGDYQSAANLNVLESNVHTLNLVAPYPPGQGLNLDLGPGVVVPYINVITENTLEEKVVEPSVGDELAVKVDRTNIHTINVHVVQD